MRAAMPNTVRNPTSEPSDSTLLLNSLTASTPPTSEIGRSRKASSASLRLPKAAWSRSRIAILRADPERPQPVLGLPELRRLADDRVAVALRRNLSSFMRFWTSVTAAPRSEPSAMLTSMLIRRDCSLTQDRVRDRDDPEIGDVAEPDLLARPRGRSSGWRHRPRCCAPTGSSRPGTSYALPPAKMSETSSPATQADVGRTLCRPA